MKKSIKTIETIYGGYASREFIEGLKHISHEARIRANYHLSDLVQQDTTDDRVGVVGDAINFWRLLEQHCKEYLDENKTI